jgi:DNA polymerase (family 10)
MENEQIAGVFAAMADILAIQGESTHRILAYRRGAETVSALGHPIEEVWQAGKLETLPGIGKVLAAKIDELMRTGRLEAYEKLRVQVPAGVVEMLRVPGVGPKRAAAFWKDLGIESVEALGEAAREGRLRALPGVGTGTEEQVLEGIGALSRGGAK